MREPITMARDRGNTAVADVDTPEAEVEEVAGEVETVEASAEKETKATRPPVPDGYITPIQFAKELGARLSTEESPVEIKPQVIYSYIKNSSQKDPLVTYSEGGRNNLLKSDEAHAWWDRKAVRVAERAANAKAKADKKAEKAAAGGETVEAESAGEVTEAE